MEDDPSTFGKAMSSPDSIFWKNAVNSEYDSIMSNNTCKTIGCKWLFKKKLKPISLKQDS